MKNFNIEFLTSPNFQVVNSSASPYKTIQAKFLIDEKFYLSVVRFTKESSLYEIALIHRASNDIVTVRSHQTEREIEAFVEAVKHQSIYPRQYEK